MSNCTDVIVLLGSIFLYCNDVLMQYCMVLLDVIEPYIGNDVICLIYVAPMLLCICIESLVLALMLLCLCYCTDVIVQCVMLWFLEY